MRTNRILTSVKQGGIFMLALPLLLSTLRAQSSPVITQTKVTNPGVIGVYGSGFGATPGSVSLAGSPVPVFSWSDSQVSVTSPWADKTSVLSIVVTTSTNATASSFVAAAATTLASSVSDRDSTATFTNVSLNGKGNQISVAAGAAVTVEFKYTTTCSGSDCPIAVQLGWNTGEPSACFYANKIGSSTQTLTAPTTPGIYYVLVDRNQNFCNEVWDYGTPPLTQSLGTIFVP